MSLLSIFWNLFWWTYDNLNYNYIDDIAKELSDLEINKMKKGLVVKKKLKKENKYIYFRIALPKTQQNNWKISCFITMTQWRKRMSYHWIFYKINWKTNNYWVRNYKHLWKNDLWYDEFEALWEKCYKWHWWLYNWNTK